jgi:hypothetical protein
LYHPGASRIAGVAEEGCLVISDITGYTAYLNQAELDHARDSLTHLVQVLVDHTRSPLQLIELEGDAVFSYAPAGAFVEGQTILEIVETTYLAFRKALELMVLNTTCACNACRLLPRLDLKFFVHHGSFAPQTVAGRRKLVGRDVNLIHRLLKNSIAQATGLSAYAAYTAAVVERLGLQAAVAHMPRHRESYPDIGEVVVYVEDMAGVWERRRSALRVEVSEQEALAVIEFDFPAPPSILWEYITRPDLRGILLGSQRQTLRRGGDGRAGPGAVYTCAHGSLVTHHTILDWRPFESYTTNETYPLRGLSGNVTYRLVPTEAGTRLVVLAGKTLGPALLRPVGDVLGKRIGVPSLQKGAAALRARLEADLAAGSVVPAATARVAAEEVRQAVEARLAGPEG